MNFKDYQKEAIKTLVKRPEETSNELLARLALGVADEAGEVAGKTKKWLRGDYGYNVVQFKKDIRKEIGDVLWYLAVLSKDLFYKFDLDKIAEENIEKLAKRQKEEKIRGSGDNR